MTTTQGILACLASLASLLYWTSGVEGAEATTSSTEDITGNSGQQCCNQKSVGDYEYKLINMENTSAHQCKDGCVYTRYGEQSSRYCFKVGNQPASCLPLVKSCANEALSIGINGHCTEECQIDTETACNACLSEKMSSECFQKDPALCFICHFHTPCFIVIPKDVGECFNANPFKWAVCALDKIPSRCKTSEICSLIGKVHKAAGIGCTCITTVPLKVLECRKDDPVKWAECVLKSIPSSCKPSPSEICELISKANKVAGEGCTCVTTAPGVVHNCYDNNKHSLPLTFECVVADLPQDCISSGCYLLGKLLPEAGPELPVFCDCIADGVQALAKCDEEHPGDWETIAKCTIEKGAVTCINAVCKYAERKFPEIKKTPVCGCLAATLQDVIQCHDNASNKSDWSKIIECALKSAETNCKKDVCKYAGKKYKEILATPACKK